MPYVCPVHQDIVLYPDENIKPKIRSGIKNYIAASMLSIFINTRGVGMHVTTIQDIPEECSKCQKWYYKHECIHTGN